LGVVVAPPKSAPSTLSIAFATVEMYNGAVFFKKGKKMQDGQVAMLFAWSSP
jgi:hypothetical protein